MAEKEFTSLRQNAPIGNRLALIGAVVYLLEWVAILAASPPGPLGPGTAPSDVVDAYSADAGRQHCLRRGSRSASSDASCSWSGLKASLQARPRELPLMDVAVAAMAIGVVLEVAAYAVVAGAARAAADGADAALVGALDGVGFWLNLMIFGPTGVSMLAAGAAMLRSHLFPRWLGWLAVLAGVAGGVACVLGAATAGQSTEGLSDAVIAVASLGMWILMLVTGVRLWRLSE